MKKLNKFSITGIIFILMIFTSCEKFLTETSTNDVANGDMFTDLASLESARIGMYNTLQNQYYYGGYFPMIADAYSDNGATGGYDNADLDEIGLKALTSSNIYIENCWIAIYNTIYTANQIILNIDGINDPLLSDELRNDIKGEAMTIRALAHFDVLRMWGEHWDLSSDLGIPVVTNILSPDDAAVPRSSVVETYNAIIIDLTSSMSFLSIDDLRFDPPSFKGAQFITKTANQALLARVMQYKGDNSLAQLYADTVINSGFASVMNEDAFPEIYSSKFAQESIFELDFNVQDKSQYNALTYSRPDALRSEVNFLVAEDLKTFFESRSGDLRYNLVDFINNDVSIEPDGRTQKYRGEIFQDNSAYIFRISEMYLIRAEAYGFGAAGIEDINFIRNNRGLSDAVIGSEELFLERLLDERRSELNFEGHRFFDLAHFEKVSEILGEEVLPCLPIPARELGANGALVQYPGY